MLPDALHCKLPSMLWSTVLITLNYTLPAMLNVYIWFLLIAHSQPGSLFTPKWALKTLSSILLSTIPNQLPIALYRTLSVLLSVHSQASSQDTIKYTPKHAVKYIPKDAFKYTSNYVLQYTPRLLGSMLPSTCSRGMVLSSSLDYLMPKMLPHAQFRNLLTHKFQVPGGVRLMVYGNQWVMCGRQVAWGVWCVVCDLWCVACDLWCVACNVWHVVGAREHFLAEIITLSDIIVWMSCLEWRLQQGFKMPQGHGIHICRLWFCRICRQFDLGKSGFLTVFSQRNV